jgi:hypothetical protein
MLMFGLLMSCKATISDLGGSESSRRRSQDGVNGPAGAGGVEGAGGVGTTGGANGTNSSLTSSPAANAEAVAACQGRGSADTTPIRLLTLTEYNNTLSDLLGDSSAPLALSPSAGGVRFDNDASALSVSARLLEHYMEVAEGIATRAVARLGSVVPCNTTMMDTACLGRFVQTLGRRAYRRPLSAEEQKLLQAVFDKGAANTSAPAATRIAGGAGLLIETILQSPDFLYHVEVGRTMSGGSDPEVRSLTGHEVASRLSYFLWNTMPDEALFTAASKGELDTPEGIATQARRLLESPRARAGARHFHTQWLGLNALDQVSRSESFTGFTPEVRADMKRETLEFLENVIWEARGGVSTMFSASYTMLNPRLAQFYGVSAGAGTGFSRVELNPMQRKGLLTQGSLMAINAHFEHTSPIHRGVLVRQRVLCQSLPSPPPNIPPLPEVDARASAREQLAQHRSDPSCAGCHQLMDPIGFGFEHYDAVGRYRTKEPSGDGVDARGELTNTQDADGTFNGAIELSERLAKSEEVRECVSTQWFRYAMGRTEGPGDVCTLAQIRGHMASSKSNDYPIRDLMVAITQTDAFRMRRVPMAEGACQ